MEPTNQLVTPPSVDTHEEVITTRDRPPLLSWGAIFAGLFFIIAISWLLNLLGVAFGVSVADASDGEAMGQGLTLGVIIWIVLSALIAHFIGSLLAARLSGKLDDTVGMLHGLTLWSISTTLILVLSYYGVTGLLQTGYSVVSTTASAAMTTAGSVTNTVATGATSAANMAADAADTEFANNIQARLKRRAANVIARSEAQGGEEVTSSEVREAMESLDQETLTQVSEQIISGNLTNARETIAQDTGLTESEVREIVDGISQNFQERIGTADNDQSLAEDISNAVERRTADFVAGLDARGGADVSREDVRETINQLTPETLEAVAWPLIQGRTQAAKDALTARTNLSASQVNDVVEGVSDDVSQKVDQYQQEAAQAVETASTYAQGVLWTVFLASAMGLAVSLLGGYMGAETCRKLEVEVRHGVPGAIVTQNDA